ncbi:MAG: ferredoxin [Sphingomonadales bacterium]
MKVVVHNDHCIASGACVLECPEVFQQDDTGLVVVLQEEPEAALHEAVRRAMAACPAAVIEIEE